MSPYIDVRGCRLPHRHSCWWLTGLAGAGDRLAETAGFALVARLIPDGLRTAPLPASCSLVATGALRSAPKAG
jgi:hypothetical protein